MPNPFRPIVEFIRGELRLMLSLGVLLAVLVGISLAVEDTYRFDFGDGVSSGLEAGYLPVDGGASTYPVTSGSLQYGWLDDVLIFSNGAAVESRLNRDGNKGADPARFRVSGITNGTYRVSIVSGSLDSAFSTKVIAKGQSFVTNPLVNQWNTLTLGYQVTDGTLDLRFERGGGNLWGVNSLTIAPSPAPVTPPTFDVVVQPSSHTVRVGGSAVYRVSLTALNGYASLVDLSVSGLVGGLTAQWSPAAAIPPFTSDLTITSAANTPLTQYDFVVTAKGQDSGAYTVNKSISLILTNSTAVPTVVTPGGTTGGANQPGGEATPGTGVGSLDDAYLTPRTTTDVKSEQKLVDDYAAVEAKKLADAREILEIKDITTINGFEITPPVEPRTSLEASLQYLAQTGIISTVVDSAPPAPAAAPRPIGFWERLFKVMVNPAI